MLTSGFGPLYFPFFSCLRGGKDSGLPLIIKQKKNYNLSSYKPPQPAVLDGDSMVMQVCPFQAACALEKAQASMLDQDSNPDGSPTGSVTLGKLQKISRSWSLRFLI